MGSTSIKAFFGSYKNACDTADAILFEAGDANEIDNACAISQVGRLTSNALWIHRDAVPRLSPILRIYEGCARAYVGSMDDMNIVKLHRFSGKVSYLSCDGFENEPHPSITSTVKLSLRSRRLEYFDQSEFANPLVLDQKERMVAADHPSRNKFKRLSRQEMKRGLIDSASELLTQRQWQERLNMHGCYHRGHRLVNEKDDDPKANANASLPKRSKLYGVGKEIGGNVYVHQVYESVFGECVEVACKHLPKDFDFTVVKLNLATKAVTFISSPDFDTADEPIVGRFILVRADGTTLDRKQLADPYIYHHKWLMVMDDYTEFDVEQSKQRSLQWLALNDVDKSRIGRKSFWDEHVLPRMPTIYRE